MENRKLIKLYLQTKDKVDKLKEKQAEIRQELINRAKENSGVIDLEDSGLIVKMGKREDLDKRQVRLLLGKEKYEEIVRRSEYPIMRIYTDKEDWLKAQTKYPIKEETNIGPIKEKIGIEDKQLMGMML